MSKLKAFVASSARWSWFVLLVLLAFGYLAAGLSKSSESSESDEQRLASQLERSNANLAAVVERVDFDRAEVIQDADLRSAEQADWLTVCRRMSLAMVGHSLSLEEIRSLQRLPESERESTHLENLLNDTRFHHYWGERWTRFLVGTDEGQFIMFRRRRFRVWLAEAFAGNRPYDQLVRELITAEGLWTDRPEVNFLTATFDSNDGSPDPVRLAARTSRAFLGLRIDCLQCHSDFTGKVNLGDVNDPREGEQRDFHQLAAFFSSAKSTVKGVAQGEVQYNYKYLYEEEEEPVDPAVPYSPELLPAEGNPRERLSAWITHPQNRQAARAGVSHVWALMFGRPMGEEIDNLPLSEPVHPMIDTLADDFVTNGFDMRRLIRVIASSAAFRVSSRASFEVTESHEDTFAVFPLIRLRPEQVAGNVIQAGRIKKTDRESSLFLQLQNFFGTNEFVTRYGDMGEDEFATESVTITQRLLLMNGQMLKEIVSSNPVLNATAHIGMFASDDEQAVETMYLCTLNRQPTTYEKEHFARRLSEAESREEAIEDMAWVLLNSSELSWNH